MIKAFLSKIKKEQFEPNILGLISNPFYIARKGLFQNIKAFGENITGKTLDVGCGTKPYMQLFRSAEYVGLEFDTGIDSDKKTADFYYDGKTFPFNDNTFDSVVTNQVLEHVFNPDEFISEIRRVLKPKGKLLLTVPFVWDEHEQPFDYARYSSFGLKDLLIRSNFRVIKESKSINDFRVIAQLTSGYLYKISRNNRLLKMITMVLFIFPVNVLGILLSKMLPNNNDLYLDNIVLAEKN